MSEDELKKQLYLLSLQADRILVSYKALLIENAKLLSENNKLNDELNIKKNRLKEVENQYNNLKLAQAFSGGKTVGNQLAKQKIKEMIREIDNCITLLKTSK